MAADKTPVEVPASFMQKAMEYAKNPQYVMMFLGFIFLLTIGFMMYKKPDMLQKLMNPNSSSSKPPPANGMNEEENEHQQGADL